MASSRSRTSSVNLATFDRARVATTFALLIAVISFKVGHSKAGQSIAQEMVGQQHRSLGSGIFRNLAETSPAEEPAGESITGGRQAVGSDAVRTAIDDETHRAAR